MQQKNWERLTFFEQLSNIAGEVKRLIDSHEAFLHHEGKDYSVFYLDRIKELVKATFLDPKNDKRREPEIMDEVNEVADYLQGKYTADYVMSYWDQYTKAVFAG